MNKEPKQIFKEANNPAPQTHCYDGPWSVSSSRPEETKRPPDPLRPSDIPYVPHPYGGPL